MKIIIHTDEYYPTAQACAYRMQVLADSFTDNGNEVTVITSSANKESGEADLSSRREKIIFSPTVSMKKKTSLMRLLNNASFGLTSFFSALRAGSADVVITTSPPALISISGWLIARIKRAKLVYDVRDVWPDVALEMGSFTEDSLFCRIFSAITSFMYKHADVITTVSAGKVAKLSGYAAARDKKRSDKVLLVSNGFDESVADYDFYQDVIDKYEIDRKPTCVYIGNIGLAQGLGALLDLAHETRHKEIQFLCFGKGAEKEMLEKRVADEGLTNVRFCGVIEHEKVFSVLSRAKLSFIPLKSGNMKDSVPTKIYEALGVGCPVLLVAEGDAAAIVDEAGLGVHVPPDDKQALTAAFDGMLDDYDRYTANKEHSMRLMRSKYSRQESARAFEEQLHNLCGK